MRPNRPNRTPFDNNLVNDPNAPRHTQPLPSSPPRTQPAPGMGRTLPPQVVTGATQDDDDNDLYSRRPRRQSLPTATVVGVAMMIGALAVILISTVVYRVLPRPQAPPLRPQNAPSPVVVAPNTKDVVKTPDQPETGTQPETPAKLEPRDEPTAANSRVSVEARNQGEPGNRDNGDDTVSGDEEDQTGTGGRLAAGEERNSTRARGRTRESETESDSRSDEERSVRVPSQQEEDRTDEDAGGKFVSEWRGYAISPPAGFTLRQSGRRTIWRGPDGAQLLVETASVGQRSPRSDWERLDRGFRKKYGDRYRSYGIRDTTLAGRPAAVWEFEIGTTRKIDIAVHHRGTGYAVLGSAPASRFEQVRPQIESAIQSFQFSQDEDRRRTRDRRTGDDEDSDAGGY